MSVWSRRFRGSGYRIAKRVGRSECLEQRIRSVSGVEGLGGPSYTVTERVGRIERLE